jgi:hypothetical protein
MLTVSPSYVSWMYRKCESLDVSQSYESPRLVTGIALNFPFSIFCNNPTETMVTMFNIIGVEDKLKLRPTVNRPVCLCVELPSGTHDQILFQYWQLRISWYGAPSMTRGWICNLLVRLLLGLVRAVTLGTKTHRTQTTFYCLIWDSCNLEGQVPVFIYPRKRVAQLYPPGTGFPSCRLYDSQGYGAVILTLLHTGNNWSWTCAVPFIRKCYTSLYSQKSSTSSTTSSSLESSVPHITHNIWKWKRKRYQRALHFSNTELLHSDFSCWPLLWSRGQSSSLQNGDVLFPVRNELNLYVM